MINIKKQGSLDLKTNLDKLDKYVKGNLINDLTTLAYDHFIKSFPTSNSSAGGGQTDSSSSGWVQKKKDDDHPTLNDTGALKGSIKIDKNIIYTTLDYAAYQNNGVSGWLPKREFIGKSKILDAKSIKLIIKNIDDIMGK